MNSEQEYVPLQCEHILDTGIRCGSPAMREHDFCYYHRRAHAKVLPGDTAYVLPVLETEEAIQLAVTHILRSVLKGKLDRREAATLFQGIRIAQATLKNVKHDLINERMEYMADELTPAMQRLEEVAEGRTPSLSDQEEDLLRDAIVAALSDDKIPIAPKPIRGQEIQMAASATNIAGRGGSSRQRRRARRLAAQAPSPQQESMGLNASLGGV